MVRFDLKEYFIRNFGYNAPETLAFFRYCEITKPNDLRDMAIARRIIRNPV